MLDRHDVLHLFGDQFGVATAGQLVDLGVSRRTVGRARERGAVVALLPGVFTIAAQPVGFRTRAMAVQLYCGDGAYLTGTSSGSVLGLRTMPRNPIQAAVPRRFRWQLPSWATVNCATYHDPDHVVMRADGFRIADAHLTLDSLAAQFNDHRFARPLKMHGTAS